MVTLGGIFIGRDLEYSYNEVQESVVNMVSGLVKSDMEKGDVLALVSPNSAELLLCTIISAEL